MLSFPNAIRPILEINNPEMNTTGQYFSREWDQMIVIASKILRDDMRRPITRSSADHSCWFNVAPINRHGNVKVSETLRSRFQ